MLFCVRQDRIEALEREVRELEQQLNERLPPAAVQQLELRLEQVERQLDATRQLLDVD